MHTWFSQHQGGGESCKEGDSPFPAHSTCQKMHTRFNQQPGGGDGCIEGDIPVCVHACVCMHGGWGGGMATSRSVDVTE